MKLGLFSVLVLSSCAYLNSVSLTQIPADRQTVVEANRSKFIFMAFNFNSDYADEVSEDLRSKCPGGVVSGILTKDETTIYFPGFFWSRSVSARGFCSRKA